MLVNWAMQWVKQSKKSIDTLLLICGYIVFFSVLISILSQTGVSSLLAEL